MASDDPVPARGTRSVSAADSRSASASDSRAASAAYLRSARTAARTVLTAYSTSFTLATRALPPGVRGHITAIYAMVRVADEIVDGAWPAAGAEAKIAEATAFEARIADAVESGFSSDLIVHAFAATARDVGITAAHWGPFFDSMRADAHPQDFDDSALAAYIHGSAEVIGEMCVRAFYDGAQLPAAHAEEIIAGAHSLGSALQKVNFLRDLAEDAELLGRSYFPGIRPVDLDDAAKRTIVADIRSELGTAATSIDLLPRRVRPAVWTVHGIFSELCEKIARTPAASVRTTRIRISDARKTIIAAAALAGRSVSRGTGGSP